MFHHISSKRGITHPLHAKAAGQPCSKVQAADKRLSDGKDIVLIEGGKTSYTDVILGLSAVELPDFFELWGATARHINEELTVDRLLSGKSLLREELPRSGAQLGPEKAPGVHWDADPFHGHKGRAAPTAQYPADRDLEVDHR